MASDVTRYASSANAAHYPNPNDPAERVNQTVHATAKNLWRISCLS
jgi:hypothetical protein